MSAGFYRSKTDDCPLCRHPVHPGLYGDMRAHVVETGQPARFACRSCGASLSINPPRPRARR